MIRRPPRSTQGVSSAASDVYKRQLLPFFFFSCCSHSCSVGEVLKSALHDLVQEGLLHSLLPFLVSFKEQPPGSADAASATGRVAYHSLFSGKNEKKKNFIINCDYQFVAAAGDDFLEPGSSFLSLNPRHGLVRSSTTNLFQPSSGSSSGISSSSPSSTTAPGGGAGGTTASGGAATAKGDLLLKADSLSIDDEMRT